MKTAAALAAALLFGSAGALAQTAPGGAGVSGDPSASTSRTGLSAGESTARPTPPQNSQFNRAGVSQPPSAVPRARDTASDPHSGRNNAATGAAATSGSQKGD